MEEVLQRHTSLKDLDVGCKKKQNSSRLARGGKGRVLVLIIVVKPSQQYRTRGSSESCEACQQVSGLADVVRFWYQYCMFLSFFVVTYFIVRSSLYFVTAFKISESIWR